MVIDWQYGVLGSPPVVVHCDEKPPCVNELPSRNTDCPLQCQISRRWWPWTNGQQWWKVVSRGWSGVVGIDKSWLKWGWRFATTRHPPTKEFTNTWPTPVLAVPFQWFCFKNWRGHFATHFQHVYQLVGEAALWSNIDEDTDILHQCLHIGSAEIQWLREIDCWMDSEKLGRSWKAFCRKHVQPVK